MAKWNDWEVAGWRDSSGEWFDVENGDRAPSDSELANSDHIVIKVDELDGDIRYISTSYPSDDYWIDDWLDDAYSDDGDYSGDSAGSTANV